MSKKSLLAFAAAIGHCRSQRVSYADVAFNVGAVTDYRYRGISQSRLKPALQGGVDFSQRAVSTSAPGRRPSSGSRTSAATPASRSTSTAATRARSAKASATTSAC